MNTQTDVFLETSKESMEVLGFWREEYRSTVIAQIESMYKKEVTDKWQIVDVVFNASDVLIKWKKRIVPKN